MPRLTMSGFTSTADCRRAAGATVSLIEFLSLPCAQRDMLTEIPSPEAGLDLCYVTDDSM
jgi:hypothetical protein